MRTYTLENVNAASSSSAFTQEAACIVAASLPEEAPALHIRYATKEHDVTYVIKLDALGVNPTAHVCLCQSFALITLTSDSSAGVELFVVDAIAQKHQALTLEEGAYVNLLDSDTDYVYLHCDWIMDEMRYSVFCVFEASDVERAFSEGRIATLRPKHYITSTFTEGRETPGHTYLSKSSQDYVGGWLTYYYEDSQCVQTQITYITRKDYATITNTVLLPQHRIAMSLCIDETTTTLGGRARTDPDNYFYYPSLWRYNKEQALIEEIVLDKLEGTCTDLIAHKGDLYALVTTSDHYTHLYRYRPSIQHTQRMSFPKRDWVLDFGFYYRIYDSGDTVYLIRQKVGKDNSVEFTCYDAIALFNE